MNTKQLEISLNIKDPLYALSNKDVLLSMIKDQYEGK
jgi:hypothetical protein